MNKFFLLLILLVTAIANAQEPMTVIRCTAPELQDPIQNIYVDRENKKWVGNSSGLLLVHAIDFAEQIPVKADEESLFNLPSGNDDIRWKKAALNSILGDEVVTTAFYDSKSKELWVGTESAGIFRLTTKPSLQKIGTINSSNSKLKSNTINDIEKDRDGRFWIGTDAGVLVGNPSKWKLLEKFFSIESVSINRSHIWMMGDETIWKAEEGDELYPIDIDERMVDGAIKDIAADSKGRVWIASEIVSRYNYDEESFQAFGPAQYFTSQDVNFLAVDKDDACWVGTQDKGLFLVEKASAITVTALVQKGLSCDFSQADAALKVRVTGGQPPYFYDWDNGLKGENPSGIGAGTYSVTVTDDKGKTKSTTVTVPNPKFTVSVLQEKEESAAGAANAEAVASVKGGGLPEFSFKWDNGETKERAVKLTEGPHTVTVTDQNGCTAVGSVNILQKLSPLSVSINTLSNNKCADDANASIEVAVSGGKEPYQYLWDNGSGNASTRNGLTAGLYKVTVTDATGLSSASTVDIKAIPDLMLSVQVKAPASTGNYDGQATAKASGGTEGYTYAWDTGETGATATKLGPGMHTVTVTDGNGCQQSTDFKITENILAMNASIEATQGINCNGDNSGALAATVSGGKAPYQYQWSVASLSGANPSNLPAGDYALTITDVKGAEAVTQVTLNEPSALTATIQVQAAASTDNSDGKATVKVEGGTGKYTYQWDNGETIKSAKALAPGAHTVTITDASGCTTTATCTISENILALNVSLSQTNQIDCAGNANAALAVDANGGKGPYTYQWSTAGTTTANASDLKAGAYSVTVTDAVGTTQTAQIDIAEPKALEASIIVEQAASTDNADGKARADAKGGTGKYTYQWDNGETIKSAKALAPGAHTVTITDASGCTTTATCTISENILALNVSLSQTNQIDCAGNANAALAVDANGGKGPYTYQWSTAGTTTANASDLKAGAYSVTVTDAVGTTQTAQIDIAEPKALEASIIVEQAASTDNADGKARANVKGGTGKYTYRWDNGETTEIASKLAPGQRALTVTDGSGCEAVATVTISENVLPLTASVQQTGEIKCNGDNTAGVSIQTSGGKAPFEYSWNNTAANGEQPNNLAAGEYKVTVTDATGQTTTTSITINEPSAVNARLAALEPTNSADSQDGAAKLAVDGGVGNYTYAWDSGESTANARKLGIGNHTVTISDGNGCSTELAFETKKRVIPELRIDRIRLGQVIRLAELNFDADSTVLRTESMPTLDEITYFLEQNPSISIEIGGHTNGVPPHEYCDRLSSARAESITNYIQSKGIRSERVIPKGYGKRKPIASNQTADGRRRNQRVELKILTLGGTN